MFRHWGAIIREFFIEQRTQPERTILGFASHLWELLKY